MINGVISDQVSVLDRGLHYGDGVFETFVAINDQLQHWDAHMQRLTMGCKRLKIPTPDANLLLKETQELLATQNNSSETSDRSTSTKLVKKNVVKIVVTRGVGARGYKPPTTTQVTRIVAAYPFPDYPERYYSEGVKLAVCETQLSCNPLLAGIKHLNRLEQVMAQDEWEDSAIVDGIMLNSDQHIIECTMSNIYWVTNNQLYTPDLSNCGVEGVTRANILKLAEELQLSITIGYFCMKDLLAADEVMISNSVFGVWPIRAIDQHNKQIGPVTLEIMQKLA